MPVSRNINELPKIATREGYGHTLVALAFSLSLFQANSSILVAAQEAENSGQHCSLWNEV